MPENILVVEYEPRYTDRVKQALAGQPIVPSFAKDGDEALRALDGETPKLIVLSSVVPKVSTSDLIRVIRGRKPLADTPILVTVSGYQGKSPKADAQRMGASDILPKPYSESEFLGKIQQMLGVRPDTATMKMWAPELDPEFTARPSNIPNRTDGQMTSNEIFGELLEDDHRAASSGAKRPMAKPQDDLDKMLADTLAGVRPGRKKEGAPDTGAIPKQGAAAPAAAPAAPPRPKTAAGTSSLDKMLNDTLSGLDPRSKSMKTQAGNTPIPQVSTPPPQQPAPPQPARPTPPPAQPPVQRPAGPTTDPKFSTARLPTLEAMEKVAASQPVFMQASPAAPAEEEPVDGVRFGQYVLVEKIATGGMAEVWKARMRGVEGFQKIVAIKKILPHLSDNQDFVEMFIDEAKLAAQLNHNNIIHIYDLGKIQSSYYIAMEYIDGHDLKTILKRGEERDTPMTVEIALFVASKIAAALDYAHRKHDFEGKEMGLVHRDVSPQNVLISQEGDIKLCDFGIAKAASKASHTQAGALKGKLQYMSPEQAWGRSIDRRSDVFALATVLFEMLTGRKLFSGDNELSILEQVREARIANPSQFNDEVTPEIDKIVQKALQKDPAGRYQTAGEMQRDLDAVLYTFRPTPTSADLAIYMHRLTSAPVMMHEASAASPAFSASAAAPMPHHEPESADPFQLKSIAPARPAATILPPITPTPAPAPSVAVPVFGADAPPKKSKALQIAAAIVIPVAIAGAYFATRKPATTTPPAAVTTTHAAATATPATGSVAPVTSTTVTTGSLPGTSTTLDPAKVEEEVRKRLAAEKTRLDQQQQAKAQAAATAATPAAQVRATPPPVAPTPQPVTPAPVPQPVAETRPVVPPPAPAPQSQPAAPAPAPVAERVREGDLIAAGTEGLVVPRMTRQAPVSYPPVARIQRAEGTVLMSVLVSEAGVVMDVKVIRGDARLNDAAVQAVRRSVFSPGTKDGVRVKSWVPVNISFKL
jgi:TonB family protein